MGWRESAHLEGLLVLVLRHAHRSAVHGPRREVLQVVRQVALGLRRQRGVVQRVLWVLDQV